jgi:hypothetical protein
LQHETGVLSPTCSYRLAAKDPGLIHGDGSRDAIPQSFSFPLFNDAEEYIRSSAVRSKLNRVSLGSTVEGCE